MSNHLYDTYHYLSVEEAVRDIQAGKMILITDDKQRENEADLCMAAQFAHPEAINFLLQSAHGLILHQDGGRASR